MALAPRSIIKIAVPALIILVILYFLINKSTDEEIAIEATGVIEALEAEISPKISGRIIWLCCSEGQAVKAGQEMIRIESAELEARLDEGKAALSGVRESIRESEIELERAKVQSESAGFEVESSKAEVSRNEALLKEAQDNLERAEGLFNDGYISRRDFDATRTAFDTARAQLDNARARQRRAQAELKSSKVNIRAAQARIDSLKARLQEAQARIKLIEAQLADTVIHSSINGVVAYKAFEEGEIVSPGAAVYTVYDNEDIRARVDVEETVVNRLKLGMFAKVFPSGSDRVFDARITEIGSLGGFATQREVTRGRSDIKTFRVKMGINEPQGLLKPGMTVNVRIEPQ